MWVIPTNFRVGKNSGNSKLKNMYIKKTDVVKVILSLIIVSNKEEFTIYYM